MFKCSIIHYSISCIPINLNMLNDWLYTIRWKNLLIIWISIIVIVLPHFDPEDLHHYYEFILWGIICTSVAAIGNITNDLWDVKQDRENKKKNIFIGGKNKNLAYFMVSLFFLAAMWACYTSIYFNYFIFITFVSLILLLLYNLFLKKIALLGNLVIASLTSLIFLGINLMTSSRIVYFEQGFTNKNIELLACFAFLTTLVREILKDAEDRKGDSFAGFKTIAHYLNDKRLAILIIFMSLAGSMGTYYVMASRHSHFQKFFLYFSAWTVLISIVSAVLMFIPHPSKYIRATRIVKAGMLGCLAIYLYLSW